MIFCFVAGLLLGYSLEDIILASNANIGGPTTAGAITGVVVDDELLFEVVCLSNDWGPQGDMAVVEIGSPSVDPSSVVYLTVPVRPANGDQSDRDAAKKKALEYAAYVTLL